MNSNEQGANLQSTSPRNIPFLTYSVCYYNSSDNQKDSQR